MSYHIEKIMGSNRKVHSYIVSPTIGTAIERHLLEKTFVANPGNGGGNVARMYAVAWGKGLATEESK